jgi:hypothetical protein
VAVSRALGVKVALMPEQATVPATAPEESVRVKVDVVTVVQSIASLKVALIIWLRGTSVAPFRGIVEITVGGAACGAAPVVNVHTKLAAIAVPHRFVTPVVIVAVYFVLAKRLAFGVKVAMLFVVS